MTTTEHLITNHLDVWSSVVTAKSANGRGKNQKLELYGLKKLRELILELAVRGLLVPQDPTDEPASMLLKKIAAEKARLVKEGKIKKQKKLPPIREDEKPFKLPEGWEWTRLGNITEIGPRNVLEDDTEVAFVPMPLVSTSYNGEHGQEIRKWGEIKKGYTHFKDGDIALAKITPCFENSKAAIFKNLAGGYGAGTTELHIARPIEKTVSPFYILLYLKSPMFLSVGKTKMTGSAGQKRVPKGFFSGNPLPFPPLTEQHRIVAKVDQLMALCDRLEQRQEASISTHRTLVETLLAALATAGDQGRFDDAWARIADHFDSLFSTEESIDQLKHTILQLAVMGKLVPQNPDDEPASILLKSIAAEKARLVKAGKIKKQKQLPLISDEEKPFDLPEGWEWVRFEEISQNIKHALKAGPFGSALKKSMYVESGYKVYGQEQVIAGDEDYGDYFIDEEKYYSLESCRVKPGDILISLVGTIGRVLVLSEKSQAGIINPRLVKLSLNLSVDKRFIQNTLASPLIQCELAERSHGGTMNILNLKLLKELIFPLPPISEQHRIVAKVDELMTLCERLKERIRASQATRRQLADAVAVQGFTLG